MMENFLIAINAVVPFLIYIMLGYLAVNAGIVREEFLNELNRVLFQVFFPFVMFQNLYQIDFGIRMNVGYILFAVAATLAVIVIAWETVPRMVRENSRRGVLIQGIYRSNSVLFAIPLTESIFGSAGAERASILIAFLVPIYNVTAVIIMEYYRGGKVTFTGLVRNVFKNPLILGAMAGLLFALSPVTLPACLQKPVSQLAALATPIALFVLGGTLHLSDVRKNLRYLVPTVFLKLILIPIVVVILMCLMGFSSVELFVVFCMFGTPIATASFTMAQNMGGDGDLAGELVVMTTLASIFTLFGWIVLLKCVKLI